MDRANLFLTSPFIHVLKNRNFELFYEDDSEDEIDPEVCIILQRFVTIPRVSVRDFFEDVVPFYSDEEFIRFFRLLRDMFNNIAEQYEQSDVFENIAAQRLVTSSAKSLAIFIWFCGHECVSYRNISNLFNVSISTVHSIIRRTISFLSSLATRYIGWPTVEEMRKESEHHMKKFEIPSIIGKNISTWLLVVLL